MTPPRRPARAVRLAGTLGIVTAAVGLAWSSAPPPRPPKHRDRPNVVLLVADDMGYGDVGAYGGRIPTPNIDTLASAGVRFTSAYVTAPVCTPSRAALLTGRYQQRFGLESNVGVDEANNEGLPPSEVTIANVLKERGYRTGLIGKWHLGGTPATHPNRRGFDEFYGFLRAAYLGPARRQQKPPPEEVAAAAAGQREHPAGQSPQLYRNGERTGDPGYLTDAWSREAVAFIDRHRDEPFFLYVAFNAPHVPLHATAKYLARFPRERDVRVRTYYAMISALDDAVGAITKELRETGLEQNTMVIFTSDNGCAPKSPCSTGPLNGGKFTEYEGGIRVPFIMRWPTSMPRGLVFTETMSTLDVLPTAAAAAGAALPPNRAIDGVDLAPFLAKRRAGAPHDLLFWRGRQLAAVREGAWKLMLVRDPKDRDKVRQIELFNLADDIGERNNLAPGKQDVVTQLRRALAAWEAKLPPPPVVAGRVEG